MNMVEWFRNELEAESRRTRRVVERIPQGRDDWKPHDRSMPLGRLATLVAGMPSWVALIVQRDFLDLQPAGGSNMPQQGPRTPAERVKLLEDGTAQARSALDATNDEHLRKPWQLHVAGKVVSEDPRYVVLRDTFAHLAHHRGQLTVYLRMNEVPVPAVYGPSADDNRFD